MANKTSFVAYTYVGYSVGADVSQQEAAPVYLLITKPEQPRACGLCPLVTL